jgi:hypothetical protein
MVKQISALPQAAYHTELGACDIVMTFDKEVEPLPLIILHHRCPSNKFFGLSLSQFILGSVE